MNYWPWIQNLDSFFTNVHLLPLSSSLVSVCVDTGLLKTRESKYMTERNEDIPIDRPNVYPWWCTSNKKKRKLNYWTESVYFEVYEDQVWAQTWFFAPKSDMLRYIEAKNSAGPVFVVRYTSPCTRTGGVRSVQAIRPKMNSSDLRTKGLSELLVIAFCDRRFSVLENWMVCLKCHPFYQVGIYLVVRNVALV